MKKLTCLPVVALLCAASGLIAAQTTEPQRRLPMMQGSPLLKVIDVNGNGTITKAELAAAPARLRTLDVDNDGRLSRDEAGFDQVGVRGASPAPKQPAAPRAPRAGGPARRPFNAYDSAANALDLNHDGEISSDEIDRAPMSFRLKLDKDDDGTITEDEVR